MKMELNLEFNEMVNLQNLLEREIEVMYDSVPEQELKDEWWLDFTTLNLAVDQMEDQELWEVREYHPQSPFLMGRKFWKDNRMERGEGLSKEDMEREVHRVTQDYGLYVGKLLMLGKPDTWLMSPKHYVDLTMEDGEGMAYEVCVGFLLQFHDYDGVVDWVNSRGYWNE